MSNMAAEGAPQVQPRGSAESTEAARRKLKSHWNDGVRKGGITLTNGKTWDEEWDPTSKELWQQVAGYLIHIHTYEYTVPGSSTKMLAHLSPKVAKDYFIGLVHLAKTERFLRDATVQKFFECTIEPQQGSMKTPDQLWYFGLKTQVWDQAYDRAAKAGELTDKSAKPIYPEDCHRVAVKCSQEDSPQSSLVKLVVNSNLRTGGRPMENCFINIDAMEYDTLHKAVKLKSPQVI